MSSRKVLVVEDEMSLQNVIRMKLEKSNFEVVTAQSVPEAMEHLNNSDDIALIWLDHYLLGKESGLHLITELKAEGSKWKTLPIFVVSNTASEEKVSNYLHLGANKYYTKSDHRLDSILSDMEECLLDEGKK
jgi:DNA-binding response OmpR family regulator